MIACVRVARVDPPRMRMAQHAKRRAACNLSTLPRVEKLRACECWPALTERALQAMLAVADASMHKLLAEREAALKLQVEGQMTALADDAKDKVAQEAKAVQEAHDALSAALAAHQVSLSPRFPPASVRARGAVRVSVCAWLWAPLRNTPPP